MVFWNRFKTNKNPDGKNPDLAMDFKNLDRKPKVKTFVKSLWLPKEILDFGKENHSLVKNLWKSKG